jgi:hypothetical protein
MHHTLYAFVEHLADDCQQRCLDELKDATEVAPQDTEDPPQKQQMAMKM